MSLRTGDVVEYTPLATPYKSDARWCREGIAIRHGDGSLIDTFWGSSRSSTGGDVLSDAEVYTAVKLFHLDDYDELGRGSESTWKTYHPRDRRVITEQHGLTRRYFIRKGASPDLSTQIANAKEAVKQAEDSVRSAETILRWRREELAALESKS